MNPLEQKPNTMFLCTLLMFAFCFNAIQSQLSLNLNTDLQDTDNANLKTVTIKGVAKYKPGGDSLLLSLLIKGGPGLMPGSTSNSAISGSTGALPTSASAGGTTTAGPISAGGTTTAGPISAGGTTTAGPISAGGTTTSGPISTGGTTSSGPTNPTSTPFGISSNAGNFKDYEEEALELHNQFRAVHRSQPMVLDETMNQGAQAYAEKIAHSGKLQHASKEERAGQGENLSYGCSSKKAQTIKEAVTNWYNEVCKPGYDFNGSGSQSGTGHFTQVVWDASVKLGIGRAEVEKNGMKCAYIVGRYEPQGNFDTGNDDYRTNVKKGSFDRSTYCATITDNFAADQAMKKSHLHKKHH